MSRKYQEKAQSGREFVDRTIQFNGYTIDRCMKLPEEWQPYLTDPLVQDSNEIERLVVVSNRIYISKANQTPEDFVQSTEERDSYLYKALQMFDDFDIKFERMMSYVDVAGSEMRRLKNEMYKICDEFRDSTDGAGCLRIKLIAHKDSMEYTSASGMMYQSLKLNAKNRDYWLYLRNESENEIKKRIAGDKKAIKNIEPEEKNS